MTLEELQQVKKDREQGIIISPQTWMKVLETAIKIFQDGPVGIVQERDGKKDIYTIMEGWMDQHFADVLPVGAIVIAPGSKFAEHPCK